MHKFEKFGIIRKILSWFQSSRIKFLGPFWALPSTATYIVLQFIFLFFFSDLPRLILLFSTRNAIFEVPREVMKDGLISMKLKMEIERIGISLWSMWEVGRWGERIKKKSEQWETLSKLFWNKSDLLTNITKKCDVTRHDNQKNGCYSRW